MKAKYCSECGSSIDKSSKFCQNCGYKLIVSDVTEDKKKHIKLRQQIIESESPISPPEKMSLMPGERLLERHLDFYVSNKRLIKHTKGMLSHKTTDYHYRHIKGMNETSNRPAFIGLLFLAIIFAITGIIFLTAADSLWGIFFWIIAFFSFILGLTYKEYHLKVLHMDGGYIKIPKIKSDSGQKIANVLRTQLYEK